MYIRYYPLLVQFFGLTAQKTDKALQKSQSLCLGGLEQELWLGSAVLRSENQNLADFFEIGAEFFRARLRK